MQLNEARQIAETMQEAMRPYCQRVEIAGSVRREKDDVKDVELVLVPKWENGTNLLHAWAESDETLPDVFAGWIKTGVKDRAIVPWDIKPEGRYWKALLINGLQMDVFLARQENFGAIYLIRTGSASFSKSAVTQRCKGGLLPNQFALIDGFFYENATHLDTPEEIDVFNLLGLPFTAPEKRV